MIYPHLKAPTYNEVCQYEHDTKQAFHVNAKVLLRHVASGLNLDKSTFDLRTNLAGPASLGETTLHGNDIYIQVGGLYPEKVLVRACKHRQDYCGDVNNYCSVHDTKGIIDLASRLIARKKSKQNLRNQQHE